MNERENILKVFKHEKPEWTPQLFDATTLIGWYTCNESGQRGKEVRPGVKLDCFGVEWVHDHGDPMPYAGNYLLDDIADWRDKVVWPDLEEYDWEGYAKKELEGYDGQTALVFFNENGLFDRLTDLMGMVDGCCALVEDPDECESFFKRCVEYKIDLIEHVAKYFHPDIFIYTDDVAKADGLFIRPEMYRELIKPCHGQIIKAIKDNGMFALQHTCGKCRDIMEDYYEIGLDGFFPAQPANDLVDLRRRFGDQLVFVGGFDSQGPAGIPGASDEVMRKEADRCVHEYAMGGDYVCFPLMGSLTSTDEDQIRRLTTFNEEFRKECVRMGV